MFKIHSDGKNCFNSKPNLVIHKPYLIVQFAAGMQVDSNSYKGLSTGEVVSMGRNYPHRFKLDASVSRVHCQISEINGQIVIKDQNSFNGVVDMTSAVVQFVNNKNQQPRNLPTLSLDRVEHRMGEINPNAATVLPDEIVRKPDNNNRPIDDDYFQSQQEIRTFLFGKLKNGSLYNPGNPGEFASVMKHCHRLACRSGYYERINQGKLEVQPGEFRSLGHVYFNSRVEDAVHAASVARNLDGQYSYFVTAKKADSQNKLSLEGIPSNYLPQEYFNSEGKYVFEYPKSEAIHYYLKRMSIIGYKINQHLLDPNRKDEDALRLIAAQYQYGAIIRPFDQINNSLFMNLVNMQIKSLGLNGIPHYIANSKQNVRFDIEKFVGQLIV